jgi:hypothetical protein
MSGIHRGVQASIRERILIAQYVHSKVNLSICFKLSYCTFSSDVSVRIMMATMHYCRLLTITGNVALKVANAFARIHQRVSHEVFSLLSPSFPHNSYSNLSIFRRVLEQQCYR